MTIYATPYNPTTRDCTGPSTDSGLVDLDEVVGMMGKPSHRSPRWLAYITAEDQAVAYSEYIFHVDDADSTR